MSIGIATGGMYNPCYGTDTVGGAPPYRANENQIVSPVILVTNVKHNSKKMFESIQVKLIDDGGYK